jgi:hypothetical protein
MQVTLHWARRESDIAILILPPVPGKFVCDDESTSLRIVETRVGWAGDASIRSSRNLSNPVALITCYGTLLKGSHGREK